MKNEEDYVEGGLPSFYCNLIFSKNFDIIIIERVEREELEE